jgi:hypothetical protein
MEQNLKFKEKIKNRSQLSVNDEYSKFLKIHSLEMKFMVPWSQSEENNFISKRPHSEKTKSDDEKVLLKKRNIEFLGVEKKNK